VGLITAWTFVRSGQRPVNIAARLGEHSGIAHVLRKRTPACAIASMFGVRGGVAPP
jgi:hypothetical protein